MIILNWHEKGKEFFSSFQNCALLTKKIQRSGYFKVKTGFGDFRTFFQ